MCHNEEDLHLYTYPEANPSAVYVNADVLKDGGGKLQLDLTFPCNDSCVTCVNAQTAKKIASKVNI